MRCISLYLHEYIIETLRCFGELNNVINRLLSQSIDSGLVFENTMQSAPDREGAKRLNVCIDDELISALGTVRIRPTIYWFVENEIYNELSWTMVKTYKEDYNIKLNKRLDRVLSELNKLNPLYENRLTESINLLEKIRYET